MSQYNVLINGEFYCKLDESKCIDSSGNKILPEEIPHYLDNNYASNYKIDSLYGLLCYVLECYSINQSLDGLADSDEFGGVINDTDNPFCDCFQNYDEDADYNCDCILAGNDSHKVDLDYIGITEITVERSSDSL